MQGIWCLFSGETTNKGSLKGSVCEQGELPPKASGTWDSSLTVFRGRKGKKKKNICSNKANKLPSMYGVQCVCSYAEKKVVPSQRWMAACYQT